MIRTSEENPFGDCCFISASGGKGHSEGCVNYRKPAAPMTPSPTQSPDLKEEGEMPNEIWAEIVCDDNGQWDVFASAVERPTWLHFVRADLTPTARHDDLTPEEQACLEAGGAVVTDKLGTRAEWPKTSPGSANAQPGAQWPDDPIALVAEAELAYLKASGDLSAARAAMNAVLARAYAPKLVTTETRTLPGVLDDATYEQIESALDGIEAPFSDANGRWLKLHERIAAIRPAGQTEWPDEAVVEKTALAVHQARYKAPDNEREPTPFIYGADIEYCTRLARAALLAAGPPPPQPEWQPPEGWVLVPVEPGPCELDESGWPVPVEPALHNGVESAPQGWSDFTDEQRARIQAPYSTMLKAAPPPPIPSAPKLKRVVTEKEIERCAVIAWERSSDMPARTHEEEKKLWQECVRVALESFVNGGEG